MKFPAPVPPITASFSAQGIMLVGVQKGQMYYRILSWKEMYKLAKKGKKVKPEGFMKQATDKMTEMVAASTRSAAESAKLRETLKRGSTDPIPPFMPTPMRTVPMVPPSVPPPTQVMPPSSASEM